AKVVNIEPNQLIEAHQDEIPETQYQIDDVIQTFSNGYEPPYRRQSKEAFHLLMWMGFIILISLIVWILAVLII
ncbi:transcriptional regulator, partial [Staphylococcus hominis]